jgi:uncharacterized membrane-anchored protein
MRFLGGLALVGMMVSWSGAPALASSGKKATAAPKAEPAEPAEPAEVAEPAEPKYHWQEGGGKKFDVGHDIEINLPAHYAFLGLPDANTLMESFGNPHDESLLGLIAGEEGSWIIAVSYENTGYIDDKEKIDADKLLQTLKEGTLAQNEDRVKRGFLPAHIDNWDELPYYDQKVHHLVWALTVKTEKHQSLNYNTRILGRHGVAELDLLTKPELIATDRPQAAKMLAVTSFKAGSRYEDVDKKHDKIADFGLMGLILGGAGLGAAKLVKVGLLATFGKSIFAFLLALKKAIVLFFVGIWAGIKKLFGKKGKEEPANVASNLPPPPTSVEPPLTNEAKPPTGSEPPTDDFK